MRFARIGLTLACCWCLFLAGCVPKQTYYMGDYSETLYILEKDKNEEALLRHRQELETIISESGTRDLPVPPGIYAELGYLRLKENKAKEAIQLFQMESQLYPESKPFMERLIQNAKAREEKLSSAQ